MGYSNKHRCGSIFSYSAYKRRMFIYALLQKNITLRFPELSPILILEFVFTTQRRYWYFGMIIALIGVPFFLVSPTRSHTQVYAQQTAELPGSVQFARQINILPITPTPALIPTVEPTKMPIPNKIKPTQPLQVTPKQEKNISKPAQAPQSAVIARPSSGGLFIWPVIGEITQYASAYHMALDIAFRGDSQILASRGGSVEFAGCVRGGYGCHLIISHEEGYKTLYGHLSALHVSEGQSVGQGQDIGIMGATGRATGTHLHFEIRQGESFLNPINFL